MTSDEKITRLEEYLRKHYDSQAGAKTSLWSAGNYDDVFEDGEQRGRCMTLFRVAQLIGMRVEAPARQDWS